jgi:hypothetical protein
MEFHVGNIKSKQEEIRALLNTIDNGIPANGFFELGENIEILRKTEREIDKLLELLNQLDSYYSSRPFIERQRYFDAMRIGQQTRGFLVEVRESSKGDTDKTKKFREHIHKLKIALLTNPSSGLSNGADVTGGETLSHPVPSSDTNILNPSKYSSHFISYVNTSSELYTINIMFGKNDR